MNNLAFLQQSIACMIVCKRLHLFGAETSITPLKTINENVRFKCRQTNFIIPLRKKARRPITSLVQSRNILGSNERPRAEVKSTVTPIVLPNNPSPFQTESLQTEIDAIALTLQQELTSQKQAGASR